MGATRFQTAIRVVTPAAFSGIAAAYILGISRAVGETMILAVAAGMQPNLTWNPMEPAATITAYIVQVALGDLPHGSIGYQTIFAAGLDAGVDDAAVQRARPPVAQALPAGLLIMSDATAVKIQQIRALIVRHKRWDVIFGIIGVISLMIGVLTFIALFVDMLIDGAPRFSLGFLHQLPFAQARARPGILSAWVGSTMVMIVTPAPRCPSASAPASTLRSTRRKNWMTDLIEINVTNLAGVPSIVYGLLALGLFVYQFGLGQSVLTAGLTLALLILPVIIVATREAIRSIPRAIREGGLCAWRDAMADHVRTTSSRTRCPAFSPA